MALDEKASLLEGHGRRPWCHQTQRQLSHRLLSFLVWLLRHGAAAKQEKKADDGIAAFESGDTKAFFRGLRIMKPLRPRSKPMLLSLEGEVLTTHEGQQQRWNEHFATILNGEIKTWRQICDEFPPPTMDQVEVPEPSANLPTCRDVEAIMMRVKVGRAPGPDGVPSLLMKSCASILAKVYHPLMVKALTVNFEPLEWSGGRLCVIPKGKGGHMCGDSRGFL